MHARGLSRRALSGAFVVLLLVATAGFAGQADALPTGTVPTGYYESPTFGYLIRLDAAKWRVAEERSDANGDHLLLSGPAGLVAFDGYTGFRGDPEACLTAEESRVASDRGVTNLAVATDDNGNPAEMHASGWAYRIFTLRATDASGTRTAMALTIDCRTLVPGKAVLEVRHYVPLAAYTNAVVDADTLMHAVVLPRRSVEARSPSAILFYPTPNMTYTVDSSDVGTIAVTALDEAPRTDLPAPAPAGTHWVAATIAFRSTGPVPLEADAGAPYVVDQYGVVTDSAYYRWESATGDPNAQIQTLAAGSEAIAVGWFAVANGARVAAIECTCFPSLGQGTRIITSFRPRLGETGPLDFDYYGCLHYPRAPEIVYGPDGTERGLVTAAEFVVFPDRTGSRLTLAVENTGGTPWAFDPRNVVVWGQGDSWPSEAAWNGGPATGAARTLEPGERGLVTLTFATRLEIGAPLVLGAYYWAASNQEVFLSSLVPCQGSGGRPIIREAG